MRRTILAALLVALAALPAAAARYQPASPGASARLEAAVQDAGDVVLLPAGDPPPLSGALPFVHFVDLAWTARTAHLILRNPGWDEGTVRVTVASREAYGGDTRTTEVYALASGATFHGMYALGPSPLGPYAHNYLVIASDRPLLVAARAFGPRYAHELAPVALDCAGAGYTADDPSPDGFLCWIARND